jgi:hypothetical protein
MDTNSLEVRTFDPATPGFVAATVEEIRYAQELRRLIQERYLNRPAQHDKYWCIGAD